MEDTEGLTKNLATTPSVVKLMTAYDQTGTPTQNLLREVDEALRKIYVEAGGIYDNMLVVGRDGKILVDSWNGKYVGESLLKEKYFQTALDEKRFVIGELTTQTLAGQRLNCRSYPWDILL